MRSIRHGLVSIIAAILLVIGAGACGDDDAKCGPDSCANGCCDLAGQCQLWSPTSCGIAGQAGELCVSCASGQTCPVGICTGGTGTCTPQNCPGCCTTDGRCSVGSTSLECGQGGAACQLCSVGQQCQNGFCQAFSCNASTCASGCCDSQGECRSGTGEGACGQGGATCQICTAGQTCQNGQCVTAATCQNCPTGCCDANGTCITTPSNTACGTGGVSCQVCGSGQICQNGRCTCDPATCSGCCQGDNCLAGTSPTACGTGGAVCTNCGGGSCAGGQCGGGCSFETCPLGCCAGAVCNVGGETDNQNCGRAGAACESCPLNMLCQNGSCNDPSSCSTLNCGGCCLAGRCELGNSAAACGGGGQTCTACSAYEYCSPLKTCEIKPDSRWNVILEHVVIDQVEGAWIDLGPGDYPDVYVIFNAGGASGTSSTKDNVWVASFGETLTTATAQALTSSISFQIRDADDFSGDDDILTCSTVFTSQQLLRKEAIFAGCPTNAANKTVKEIKFTFQLVSL